MNFTYRFEYRPASVSYCFSSSTNNICLVKELGMAIFDYPVSYNILVTEEVVALLPSNECKNTTFMHAGIATALVHSTDICFITERLK